jgi:subtilisin family serine protease
VTIARRFFVLWGALALALGGVCAAAAGAAPRGTVAAAGGQVIGSRALASAKSGRTTRVVVMLRAPVARAGTSVRSLEASARSVQDRVIGSASGVTVRRRFQTVPAFVAEVHSEDALERLAADPNVRKIDLDEGAGTGTLANVVPKIRADVIQAGGTTGTGVTVAILDSGFDRDHPDLAGADGNGASEACFGENFAGGFCPNGTTRQTGAGAAEDDAGHGTHVAGIVTSDGHVSSVGVAPGASIVSVKVTDGCEFSGCFYTFSEITAALDYLTAHPEFGVDVINMSLGTNALYTGDCDNAASYLMAASASITNLRNAGVLAFASAGNSSSTTQMSAPACLRDVISVGATTLTDEVASFSNTDPSTDILAPGVSVVSDAIGGGTTTASGTSMASPAAAACTALLRQRSSASLTAVESALESTGVSVARGTASFPRIDCLAARDALNLAPVANAGPDQSLVKTATTATLDGGSSSDPENLPLKFSWTQLAGDPVTFDRKNRAVVHVSGLQKGKSYTFRLTVTDQSGRTNRDDVTVKVKPK